MIHNHLLTAPPITVFKTIIVPVSRPDTAADMLHFACQLIDPEEGRVIALALAVDSSEKATAILDDIQPEIDKLIEQGAPVELMSEINVSVSRGILDVAREVSADLLIMGVKKPARGNVEIGTITQNVIEAAPCDVLIYRLSTIREDYKRIVVPVNYSIANQSAMIFAAYIAKRYDLPIKLYIGRDYGFQTSNERFIDTIFMDIAPEKIIKQYVVGFNPASQILNDLYDTDLAIIGFMQRVEVDEQIATDIAKRLLNHSPSPVLLVSHLNKDQNSLKRGLNKLAQRYSPRMTIAEQNELLWQSRKFSETSLDYLTMSILSAGLATVGLMQNSVAVIIGAMLVAPLMQPIGATATGVILGRWILTRKGLFTLLQGVAIALLISIFLGFVLNIQDPTSEMLARGRPNILDAAVALISGMVAAYATARKGISAALAGVAIAAALMPPLCSVGLFIALRQWPLALGAGLLFSTNIIFIIVAEYIVFFWMGMRPRQDENVQAKVQWIRLWWGVFGGLALLTILLLGYLGNIANIERNVTEQVYTLFPDIDILDVRFQSTRPIEMTVIVQAENDILQWDVAIVQKLLEETLNEPVKLSVISEKLVKPSEHIDLINYFQTIIAPAYLTEIFIKEDAIWNVTATIETSSRLSSSQVITWEQQIADFIQMPVSLLIKEVPVSAGGYSEPSVTAEATTSP